MAGLTLHLPGFYTFGFFPGEVIICEMGVRSGDKMAESVGFWECISQIVTFKREREKKTFPYFVMEHDILRFKSLSQVLKQPNMCRKFLFKPGFQEYKKLHSSVKSH